jgi:nucleotide-binding universal stress UspA family protein
MSYRILVPLDGGDIDDEVLPYVRKFVLRDDALVTLLHVLPDLSAYEQAYITRERDRAIGILDRFRAQLNARDGMVNCELRMGEPVSEIVKAAALMSVNLIVMPTHARKGLERLLSGSVAEHVMRQAHAAMLMPPVTGGRPQDRDIDHLFDSILVPIDGSGSGYAIIPLVVEFARFYESRVILFHDYRGFSDTGEPLDMRNIDERIEDYKAMLGYAGISVSLQSARSGHPAEEILEAVSGSDADIIAMATHGRSGLDRLTNGSVVEHVLRNASRPLLVCKSASGLSPVVEEKYIG